MKIGIVGHAANKFTSETEAEARAVIRSLLEPEDAVLVSGHCHLGGIDVWAEEIAEEMGRPKIIHVPKQLSWLGGYKERNERIAADSDEVHCIVVAVHPPGYSEQKWDYCYHCKTRGHVKSGGCWTAWRGKKGFWHVIGKPIREKGEAQ
jgi:hypothetical protein